MPVTSRTHITSHSLLSTSAMRPFSPSLSSCSDIEWLDYIYLKNRTKSSNFVAPADLALHSIFIRRECMHGIGGSGKSKIPAGLGRSSFAFRGYNADMDEPIHMAKAHPVAFPSG